ncbi:MAG: hypothetical protein LBQ67_02400 [Treponema sp.]|nr:hypothetical protein [Treponema sp.]
MILCVPFQLGFKRSIFLASLSRQELNFFQRYINGIVGLSIALNPERRSEPIKFFIRCNLSTVGQMKGRENVGLFVLDFKISPNEMIIMLGEFMENQDRLRTQYEDYGNTPIKVTPDTAKILGYNMYATIMEPKSEARRIQVYSFSSKTVEHMEAAGASIRPPGTSVAYQFFFKKYRVSTAGTIAGAASLSQGIIRTTARLAFSPDLVEIIDDYWFTTHSHPSSKDPH